MSSTAAVVRKPLLCYSAQQDRASIVDISMSPAKKSKGGKTGGKGKKGGKKGKKGKKSRVKVVKGKVNLKVGGFSGVQHLLASHLVQYIPLNKLKAAARKVLVASGIQPTHKKSGKGKKKKKKTASS